MKSSAYTFTLVGQTERIELGLIADNTVQAFRTGIAMIPACFAFTRITCKPAKEPNTCAAL